MRDELRIRPFLKEIGDLWENNASDWRFGQLISNVLLICTVDPFFLEDDETLEIFRRYFKKEKENDLEKAIKNLKEIVELSNEEIEKNDENISAVLDLEDLKALKIVLDSIENK